MILSPGEQFSVVRQLQDPNDAGTYYVRAVIRNALTDAIIATLDLTDRGNQRFSYAWRVAEDPTGLGYYIAIETRVYTDSGYSSLSDAYGQENTTYLVDNRFRTLNAGGGGDDIDYKKLKKIVLEALGEFKFPEFPKISELVKAVKGSFDFTKLLGIVSRVEIETKGIDQGFADLKAAAARIEAKEFPEIKETDLSPVLDAIEALPAPAEPTDITPVTAAIEELKTTLDTEALKGLQASVESFKGFLESEALKKAAEAIPGLAEDVSKVEGKIKDFLYVLETKGAPKDPGPEKPDYHAKASEMLGIGLPKKTK